MTRDELLERGDETVTIRQIVERFESVEQEYSGMPWTLKQIYTQIDMLVSEKTCGDCISREAVLKAIDAKAWEFCDYLISNGRNDEQKPVSHFADNLRECVVEDLPSVSAQQKMGRWEWNQYDANPKIGNFHCSLCHSIGRPYYDYCPGCGAKIEVIPNETDY